ncbi:MAG: CPBP family intramembrane glutamic endopeptidase [Chthoniobacterales bacterium]
MNPLVKILCYLGAVVLSACLLSPPVYWGFQWLIHHGWFSGLAGFPFHRYFSRLIQIAALVYAWPFIRWLNVRTLSELGILKNSRRGADFLAGFGIGFLPMAILAVVYLSLDIYHFRNGFAGGTLFRIAITAIVVAMMEELFFRGILLGLALRITNRMTAILGVSIIFGLVHFLKPAKGDTLPEVVTWMSGFHQAGTAFSSLTINPGLVLGGMATLVVAGVLLGFCTVATKSLWLAIGVHASWIFGQQTLNLIARYRIKPTDALLPWVGPSQVSNAVPIGIWAVAALGITGLCLWGYLHERSRRITSAAA